MDQRDFARIWVAASVSTHIVPGRIQQENVVDAQRENRGLYLKKLGFRSPGIQSSLMVCQGIDSDHSVLCAESRVDGEVWRVGIPLQVAIPEPKANPDFV